MATEKFRVILPKRQYSCDSETDWGAWTKNQTTTDGAGNLQLALNGSVYYTSGTAEYVYDAGLRVVWSAYTAVDNKPANTNITYEFASSDDNVTFSSFVTDISELEESRYLKIRITLTTNDTSVTPTVDSISITVSEANVTAFKVVKAVTTRIKKFELEMDDIYGDKYANYDYFDDIEIWRGNPLQRIFKGRIETINPVGKDGKTIQLSGRDYTAKLLDETVIKEYTNTEISAIVTDIITSTFSDITTTNVETTTKNITVSYKNKRIFKVFRELADMAGFEFWIDGDKDLHFEPRGVTDSGKVLDENTNIFDYNFPHKAEKIVNKVTFYGGFGIAVQVEDKESQKLYGVKHEIIVDPSVSDSTTAKERATAYLSKYSNPIRIGTIVTYGLEDIDVGQLITVNITGIANNAKYYVMEITYEYPPRLTKLLVAEYKTGIADLIASLRQQQEESDLINADLEATIEKWLSISKDEIIIEEISLKIWKQDANDTFVLGQHTQYAKLGTGKLGNRAGEWVEIYSWEV